MIERAARRGDDDVGAALERADLLVHRRAAVERQHRSASSRVAYLWIASATCIASSRVGTRTRPGRAGAGPASPASADPLQHRQRERRGLARARGRLAEHVPAREQQRDRLALDRRRFFVAERGDGREDLFRESEAGKPGRSLRIGLRARQLLNVNSS